MGTIGTGIGTMEAVTVYLYDNSGNFRYYYGNNSNGHYIYDEDGNDYYIYGN
jgi:hypothetical protein